MQNSKLTAPPPKHISIEPSSKCNLHCVMCTRETLEQKPLNENMAFEDFKTIVDQFEDPDDVVLCGIGEPLLNKHIVDMVQYISDKGWDANVINNATLMTEKRSNELIDAGLKRATFSIHGGTAETHHLIRQGPKNVDSLERVYGNIKKFVEIRNEKKADTYVIANYLAARQTVSEFGKTLEKAKEIGIDEVVALRLINVHGTLADLEVSDEQAREMVNYKKLAKKLDIKFSFWQGEGGCRELWECIFVMSNGDVGPCDGWVYDMPPMGNLFKEHVSELWNGQKYQDLRQTFLNRELEWCDNCCLGGSFETPVELLINKFRRRVSNLVQLTR